MLISQRFSFARGIRFTLPLRETITIGATACRSYSIIAREKRVNQNARASAIEARGCGVLDTPLELVIGLAERRDPVAVYHGQLSSSASLRRLFGRG
jgi:hypothetical protein